MTDRWIVVRNWERFQHYSDRVPSWIKNYVELMSDDAYLGLTLSARGVLHGIWLEYAASRGQLPGDASTLTRRLGQKVPRATLESLSDAGFIEFVASKPLAQRYQVASSRARARSREERREEPPQTPPQSGGAPRLSPNGKLSARALRRFTGCRAVRGSHGASFVRDVLGTDRPPSDWPHEPPSRAQVEAALTKEEE